MAAAPSRDWSRPKDEKTTDEFAAARIAQEPEDKERYVLAAPPRTLEALARPARRQDSEESRRYWERIDNLFYSTVRTASRAFRTILSINLVIVIIGIAFVANSLAFTWLRPGTDAWTTSLISGA